MDSAPTKETPTVQARGRKVGRYQPRVQRVHASFDAFLGAEHEAGIHTIRIGTAIADVLYEDRGGPLLVTFPAAITDKVTWPFFSGLGIASRLNASLLAFSDPSTAIAGVPTGWTLGDSRVPFHQYVPRMVEAFAAGRRVVFLGLSAGGFAALHYSALTPGSVAVVGNPRTHLLTPPTAVQYWARILYGTTDPSAIGELVPLTPAPSPNRVIYLQNAGDHRYFAGHMIPYLYRLTDESDLWALIDHWGDGHIPPPRDLLNGVLAACIAGTDLPAPIQPFETVDAMLASQAKHNIAEYAK